jgi:putative membrane protein
MMSFKKFKITSLLICMLGIPMYVAAANDSTSAGILSTIITIDQNEILAAVQALNSDTSSDVTDFANMMLKDHGKNLTEALALANKIHALPINPNPSDMHNQGSKELVTLGGEEGKEYEKAYVAAMVKGHTGALKLITDKFLKTAKNDDLKTFLTNTKEAVAHHLEEAKKLQDSMKS